MVTRGHNIIPQKDTTVNKFKADIIKVEKNDWVVYEYSKCLTSSAWDDYVRNQFDVAARKEFIKTISFPCMDSTKP